MNREEFNEMRKEFGDYLYNYELFLKANYMTDLRYVLAFADEMESLHDYESENRMLVTMIKMRSEAKTDDEIEAYVKATQEQFVKETLNMANKRRFAAPIINNYNKLTVEERKQFEEEFHQFCVVNHPLVRAYGTQEYARAFDDLRKAYFESDYARYKELLELNKDGFAEVEVPEERFNEVSMSFYNNKKAINTDFNRKRQSYPYTKVSIFKDDMDIAREKGEIKAMISNMIKDNHQLQDNVVKVFGKEYKVKTN